MSVSVSLENSRRFTRESLTLIGGGAVAGAVATALDTIAGDPVPQLTALSFGAVVGLIANLTDSREGTPMLRLVLAILAGGAMALLVPFHWAVVGVAGGLFLGLAFSLDEGTNRVEQAYFAALYAIALAASVFTTQVLEPLIETPLLAQMFQGTTWGLFLALAGGLKRLKWSRDPILAAYKETFADLEAQERETVHQGRVLYEQIRHELERVSDEGTRARAEEIAAETSQALLAITRRAADLRNAADRTSQRRPERRIAELDERIEQTNDPTVRHELQAALDEIVEQIKARRRFDVARVRLEARQQRCFTALERLHVALVQRSGGDDAAVHESIASLEKLSDEIRWRNLSVEELCAGSAEEVSDADADEILEQIRAESIVEDVTTSGVVLDSGPEDHDLSETDGPPGTDGSVAAPQEVEAGAGRNTSS